MTISRRAFVGALTAMAAGCQKASVCPARTIASHASEAFDVVDLSHSLGPSSPYIHVRDATFPFRREPIATIATRGVYANRWELTEHIGTHLDAPCHFDEHAPCVDALPLADLFAEAVVIDVSSRAEADEDTELTLADLRDWQAKYGPFPQRCAVLLYSGWDRRWPSQERFANRDAADVMHFPGFSRAAVERLAKSPEVLGIGTDTFSLDPGRDARYEGHRVLSSAGKWALDHGTLPQRSHEDGGRREVGHAVLDRGCNAGDAQHVVPKIADGAYDRGAICRVDVDVDGRTRRHDVEGITGRQRDTTARNATVHPRHEVRLFGATSDPQSNDGDNGSSAPTGLPSGAALACRHQPLRSITAT